MDSDRELMMLAAKAAGYEVEESVVGGEAKLYLSGELLEWNPKDKDDDALRLAVALDILIDPSSTGQWCETVTGGQWLKVEYAGDPMAATRLAILRAAAAIGKAMPD